ncbi:MAG: glycosyltransferase family 1 protein [Candidatus Aminicenantes bacterium]|nr:MAG: glycosyltransferase family 1 protein [Candidatus Aminicenantes bacterium]
MVSKGRLLVVTSDVPFVEGGHLMIARSTVQALRQAGYEADLVLTPQNRFGRQFQAYLANWLTDVGQDGLGREIDQVISFRFPSYAVRHPRHVCWLNHRLREYYDLWEMLASQLSRRALLKEKVRRLLIHALDRYLLKKNVTKLYAQSQTIQARLQRWGKIPSEVLYPPPPPRNYRLEKYDNFIFSVSRLHPLKRLHLLVEAFKFVRHPEVKAVIIGQGPEKSRLEQLIKDLGLEKRFQILSGVDEKTVMDHYARCRAVFFAPFQEDYGFVTGEAFACSKPVLTTTDSGGPSELVEDGRSGFTTPPDPQAIAAKIDLLAEDQSLAERLGRHAQAFIATLSWEKTVSQLVLS